MKLLRYFSKNRDKKNTIIGFFIVFIIILIISFFYYISSPVLKEAKLITIPEGYSIRQSADLLESSGIIRSGFLASIIMRYKKIFPKSGSYKFQKEESLLTIINRIVNSDYGDIYKKITIPEGSTNKQIINIITKSKFNINRDNLVKLISGKEGYLFPETYSFLPEADEEDIVKKMEDTFLEKISIVEKDETIQKTRSDIVIMASILEKEASNNLEQKQIISGILWKRINIGMPLQVDAPFLYEIGKGSSKLSNKDLQKDSPYNTYINKGLTPTPIGNPGYDSLYASAHPINSEYMFYLHGKDGNIHYGKTYSEHLKNKRIYLR